MRFDIPDFSLLTGLMPDTPSLKGRVVIFHFPTHTILELVKADDSVVNTIAPRYEWEWTNKYGEINRFVFIVHRYITDDLPDVFEKAREWYQNFLDWMDASDDVLNEFLNWDPPANDLPN